MKDPYLYKNSNILKNRANIRDEVELKEMEADYTIYRLSDVSCKATKESVRKVMILSRKKGLELTNDDVKNVCILNDRIVL